MIKFIVPQTKLEVCDGMRVKVTENSLSEFSGGQHPQAGKTGVISEFLGVLVKIGRPRAMVKLDDGGGIAIVSLEYLEAVKKSKT
jgi:hypothetical protein